MWNAVRLVEHAPFKTYALIFDAPLTCSRFRFDELSVGVGYRVVKTHGIPEVAGQIFAKGPLIMGLFCAKRPKIRHAMERGWGLGSRPKKCTGRGWGMRSSTI